MSVSLVVILTMSGMTGYEGPGSVYPTPQYYCGDDPRHHQSWAQYHPHHQQVPHGQGSPTQRYPYYDSRSDRDIERFGQGLPAPGLAGEPTVKLKLLSGISVIITCSLQLVMAKKS